MPSRREHLKYAYALARELGLRIDNTILYTIENVIDNPTKLSRKLRSMLAECLGVPWAAILLRGQVFRHDWGLVRERIDTGSLDLLKRVPECMGRSDHTVFVDLHVVLDYASTRGCDRLLEWAENNGLDPVIARFVYREYCGGGRL